MNRILIKSFVVLSLALVSFACGTDSERTFATPSVESIPISDDGTDWDRAQNLNQSIYNIYLTITRFSFGVKIYYYDLDRVDSGDFLREVQLWAGANGQLFSDHPNFSGSYTNNCSCSYGSGTITIRHQNDQGSRMNGQVIIDYFRQPVAKLDRTILRSSSNNPSAEEIAFSEILKKQKLLEGVITGFRIQGGLVNPHSTHLSFDKCLDEVEISGTLSGKGRLRFYNPRNRMEWVSEASSLVQWNEHISYEWDSPAKFQYLRAAKQ